MYGQLVSFVILSKLSVVWLSVYNRSLKGQFSEDLASTGLFCALKDAFSCDRQLSKKRVADGDKAALGTWSKERSSRLGDDDGAKVGTRRKLL